MVAVETVLWFPRSGGRVLCVHGSGSFHRLIDDRHESGRFVENTKGRLRAAAPGVGPCLDEGAAVHVPWGIAPLSASTGPTTHSG